MKWWNQLKRRFQNRQLELGHLNSSTFKDWWGLSKKNKQAMNEATYFTALRLLSESLGKLPLHLYRDTERGTKRDDSLDVIRLLRRRPNPYMSPSMFWSTVEANKVHFGNAYVYIRRQRASVADVWILNTQTVRLLYDDAGLFGQLNALWYEYSDPQTGKKHLFHHDEILHVRTSVTMDGIVGVGVRDRLEMMVNGALASQAFMTNLSENGLSAKAVLQYTGDIDEPSRKRLVAEYSKYASGVENAGKIIPIPPGMTLTPLNLKLTDAQFVELRKINARQLAAAMGIKPNHLNDYEKSSVANSEMQNLAFYTDTLLFIVKSYEEEITYKLLTDRQLNAGYHFKFNVAVILRADQKTQAETLASYVNNGVMTPNEARELLDLEANDHGDKLVMNGNYIPLERVGDQYQQTEHRGGDEG